MTDRITDCGTQTRTNERWLTVQRA